ncbi:MAG TPA: DUF3194 domain-containing protein [Methanocella sp.]|jgi:hypothetical protein
MKDEEVITAVYDAAVDYIYSVVPSKMIEDLDVSVEISGKEISIDIKLITDRGVDVDQTTADEAVQVASEKADELLEKR